MPCVYPGPYRVSNEYVDGPIALTISQSLIYQKYQIHDKHLDKGSPWLADDQSQFIQALSAGGMLWYVGVSLSESELTAKKGGTPWTTRSGTLLRALASQMVG
jgi:hypothetical protein